MILGFLYIIHDKKANIKVQILYTAGTFSQFQTKCWQTAHWIFTVSRYRCLVCQKEDIWHIPKRKRFAGLHTECQTNRFFNYLNYLKNDIINNNARI